MEKPLRYNLDSRRAAMSHPATNYTPFRKTTHNDFRVSIFVDARSTQYTNKLGISSADQEDQSRWRAWLTNAD